MVGETFQSLRNYVLKEKSGQKIAHELGTSRQNVSQALKRALMKLYRAYLKEYPDLSAFEIVARIMTDFDIEINQKNFNLFPSVIKNEARKSGIEYAKINNYRI